MTRFATATTGSPTFEPRRRDADPTARNCSLRTIGGVPRGTVGNVDDSYHDPSERQPDGSTHSLAALAR